MKHLLKLKKLPQHFFNYERDYVAITRPEDIKEYDYLASLKEGEKIDFSQFRGYSVILVMKVGHIYSPIFNGNGYITIPIL